eukprot:Skav226198  [mRNA]  locus=scaffold2208:100808:104068:- [translate_table: standard]
MALVFENVATIKDHEHYEWLIRVLGASGFQLVWEQKIDAGKVLPATRNRWLAIAVDSYRAHRFQDSLPLPAIDLVSQRVTAGSFDMLFSGLPPHISDDMKLSDEVLRMYADAKFAQCFDDVAPWSSHREVLRARTITNESHCRTFMAAYGHQHELPTRLLKAQGIIGQILQEQEGFRFVTPQEVAMALGIAQDLILPLNYKEAWNSVGNAISPIHAGLGLLQLIKMIEPLNLTMYDFLRNYLEDCFRASSSMILTDGEWTKLTPKDDIEDFGDEETTMSIHAIVRVLVFANGGTQGVSTDGKQTARDICLDLQISLDDVTIFVNGAPDHGREIDQEGICIHVLSNSIRRYQKVAMDPEVQQISLTDFHSCMIRVREYLNGLMTPDDEACICICRTAEHCFFEIELSPMLRNEQLAIELPRLNPNGILHVLVDDQVIPSTGRLRDLMKDGVVCIHFSETSQVLRLTGGGQTKKQSDQERAIQTLVALFTTKGYTVPQSLDHSRKLVQKIGTQNILHACRHTDDDSKWQSLREEANARAFDLMPQDSMTKSAKKIQEAVRRRQMNQRKVPSIKGLSIQPGWFACEDGTQAQVLSTLAPGSCGIVLCDMEQVRDYLETNVHLSADELAAIVPWKPDVKLPRGKLEQIPVKDVHGNPAIITAAVIQMGEKEMKFGQPATGTVETEQLVNALFMVHKTDIADDTWKDITKQPVKTVLSLFNESAVKKGVVRVWSRLFQLNKTKIEPEKANVFSFQACLRDEHLHALLQQSGLNGVYMRPHKDRGTDERFAVIWTQDRVQAHSALAKLPQHKGLVFNGKNYGIRMLAIDAEAAHKLINPSRPVQPHMTIKYTYRLSPLPRGITTQALETWSKELKWPFRPLKRVNDVTWIIGSDTQADQLFLSLQGRPVLLEPTVQAKSQQRNAIVAGTLDQGKKDLATTDAWPLGDPWAQFRPTTMPSSHMIAPAPTRSLPGPAQAALTEQSARMDRIEQELHTMKESQTNLQTEIKQQGKITDEKMQRLENHFGKAMSDLGHQLQKNLADQIANQDKQLNTKFDELKELFKQRPKRKPDERTTPLKGRNEESEDEEMKKL